MQEKIEYCCNRKRSLGNGLWRQNETGGGGAEGNLWFIQRDA
jgi:hypothetical protein